MLMEVKMTSLVRLGKLDSFEAQHEDPKLIAIRLRKEELSSTLNQEQHLQPNTPCQK